MEDIELLLRAAVQLDSLHISLQHVAGDLGKTVARQVGIEGLIAQCDDHALFAALMAVEAGVVKAHVPGCCVGFEAVSAPAPLEPDPV